LSSILKSKSRKLGVAVYVISAGDTLLVKGIVLFYLRYAYTN